MEKWFLFHMNITLVDHVITDVKILALTEVVSILDGEQVWWWDSYPYLLMDCVPSTSLSKGVTAEDTTEV